jgi:hypothetical protein
MLYSPDGLSLFGSGSISNWCCFQQMIFRYLLHNCHFSKLQQTFARKLLNDWWVCAIQIFVSAFVTNVLHHFHFHLHLRFNQHVFHLCQHFRRDFELSPGHFGIAERHMGFQVQYFTRNVMLNRRRSHFCWRQKVLSSIVWHQSLGIRPITTRLIVHKRVFFSQSSIRRTLSRRNSPSRTLHVWFGVGLAMVQPAVVLVIMLWITETATTTGARVSEMLM